MALKLIHARLTSPDAVPHVVQHLRHHLVGMLSHREPRTQLATLLIIGTVSGV